MLNELKPAPGSKKKRKRLGCGPGSGHGKTSCHGQKGQKARAGRGKGPGFEGGQMPLQRRLPKKGFYSRNRVAYAAVNLTTLARFEKGVEITPELLREVGIVKGGATPVKILGTGSISVALTVRVHSISASARKKIEEAGGKVEVLG